MTRFSVLAFAAVIGVAGVAQAQTSSPPLDPNGHPYIGWQDWHAQPGDSVRSGRGQPADDGMGRGYHQQAMTSGNDGATHAFAFKDEFGFRYDAQGNRIDRQGHVISPQNTNPNQ